MRIVVFILAALMGLMAWWQLFNGEHEHALWLFLLWHLISLSVLWVLRLVEKQDHLRRTLYQVWPIAVLFPGLGVALLWVVWSAAQSTQRDQGFLVEYEKYIEYDPSADQLIPEVEEQQHVFEGHGGVRSNRDILLSGEDVERKIQVIQSLSHEHIADSVRLLKIAASDVSSEVSYVAAVALIDLEKKLQSEIENHSPDKPLNQVKVGALLSLASSHISYATSGLLQPSQVEEQLSRAQHLTTVAIHQEENHPGVHLILAEILSQRGKLDEALSAVQKEEHYNGENRASIQMHFDLLFRSKRFKDLKRLMLRHPEFCPSGMKGVWA
jgi:tetratricopeptide (TPR) repeat protein